MILYRKSQINSKELEIAEKYFDCEPVPFPILNQLVIGRYSVLPYYSEVETILHRQESYLINSYHEHRWIAGMEWKDLPFTPRTFYYHEFLNAPEGSYIVKGETNSLKSRWKTHMFARNKREALNIAAELGYDSNIGGQRIVFREYIPLRNFGNDINGCPIANEWRFFVFDKEIVASHYYWTNSDFYEKVKFDDPPQNAIKLCTQIFPSLKATFCVLDIAQTVDGDWILIEINDGQMSGVDDTRYEQLYSNLSRVYETKKYNMLSSRTNRRMPEFREGLAG